MSLTLEEVMLCTDNSLPPLHFGFPGSCSSEPTVMSPLGCAIDQACVEEDVLQGVAFLPCVSKVLVFGGIVLSIDAGTKIVSHKGDDLLIVRPMRL